MHNSLRKEVNKLLKLLDVPGALVYLKSDVYDDFLITYGYSDVKNKIKTDENDKYRIGSNTKMFIGIILLQLYMEKLIDLDDPVSKYLLGIPNGNNITIREIGEMRSGIFNYSMDPTFYKVFIEDPDRNWLSDELYTIGITNKPSFEPGTDAEYSNTNTIILALIIERITKNSIQKELCSRILKPLKLKNTKFKTNGSFNDPKMNGYQYNDILIDVTHNNPSFAWAAGAITSNIDDMAKFIKYGIGKHTLLNKDAIKQQRSWASCIKSPYFKLLFCYGFQLEKYETFLGHNGAIPGYNSISLYDISTNTTILVTINIQTTKNNISPAQFIGEFIIARLLNKTSLEEAMKSIKKMIYKK